MDTVDEKFDRSRAVWEMTQTEGWQIVKGLINREIEIETNDLLECPIAEDLEHKQMIKAYKRVLNTVESLLKEREEIAKNLQKQKE